MNIFTSVSASQLRQAANLKEQIVALEKKMSQLLGSSAKPIAAKIQKKKGGLSAAGKANIVAAQKARWAKIKASKLATKPSASPAPKQKKFKMSAAAKAKISAAAKARWAMHKAEEGDNDSNTTGPKKF